MAAGWVGGFLFLWQVRSLAGGSPELTKSRIQSATPQMAALLSIITESAIFNIHFSFFDRVNSAIFRGYFVHIGLSKCTFYHYTAGF